MIYLEYKSLTLSKTSHVIQLFSILIKLSTKKVPILEKENL